jgi:hypothetical protein
MAQIALEVQEAACQNSGLPAVASAPPSSFATALDTVRAYASQWANLCSYFLGAPHGDILGYRRLDEEATGFTGPLKLFFDSYF